MRIIGFQLHNIKGYTSTGWVKTSDTINIITGRNNSGKSTILKSFYAFQDLNTLKATDKRLGANDGQIAFEAEDFQANLAHIDSAARMIINITGSKIGDPVIHQIKGGGLTHDKFSSIEPKNVFYPFFSKRKSGGYSNSIEKGSTNAVFSDFRNLPAKINRLTTRQHPRHTEYFEACQRILGTGMFTLPGETGMEVGLNIGLEDSITIDAMGDGVPHILGLIANLCMAENKIFLIEELENDLHPEALKELLKLIIEKSQRNQFFITTHSNIVIKHLGAVKWSKLFNVDMEFNDGIPTSRISLAETPEERRSVLESLGYELFDFDLAQGWLILEESSAERIIREYLIPWFVPKLSGKLRTVAAQGIEDVMPKVQAFKNLFTFLHLEPLYRKKAWVIVDGDDVGLKKIAKLKESFCKNTESDSSWNEENFQTFTEHNFESYYPQKYQPEAVEILSMQNGEGKQVKKKELLYKVIDDIQVDEEKAKSEFLKSADEVIEKLRSIGKNL